MKEPHHYRKVGIGMIMVAGSLAMIGVLQLAIGPDVLFCRYNTKAASSCFLKIVRLMTSWNHNVRNGWIKYSYKNAEKIRI